MYRDWLYQFNDEYKTQTAQLIENNKPLAVQTESMFLQTWTLIGVGMSSYRESFEGLGAVISEVVLWVRLNNCVLVAGRPAPADDRLHSYLQCVKKHY